MKLVNVGDSFIVVEFRGGANGEKSTTFYNRYLENEMRETGVTIPHHLCPHYKGKQIVKSTDDADLFQRAFKEVYYPENMNTEKYEWRD